MVAATANRELGSLEGTHKEKNACHLAAIRLEPLLVVSLGETQGVKARETGPRKVRCISKG